MKNITLAARTSLVTPIFQAVCRTRKILLLLLFLLSSGYLIGCSDSSVDPSNVTGVKLLPTPSETPVVTDLPETIEVAIQGVDVGSTHEDVLLKLGKPLSSKKAGTNPCGGTKLTLRYRGLTLTFEPEDEEEKKFFVVSISVQSPDWKLSHGLRIGATLEDVHNMFGRSSEVNDSEDMPGAQSFFYYVSDGRAYFYFRNNKLIKIEWEENLC